MLLNQIGLVGWETIEPAIMSSILAGQAVLFYGHPGSSKSDACEKISMMFQPDKKKFSFRAYDCPSLDAGDLMGVFNPNDMAKGKLSFINTPLSVWEATAILLDEINQTNFVNQAKLHELVREQTVMGLETKVDIVFAAVNPPKDYQTNYMSIPLTSRFVCLEVPSADKMLDSQMKAILKIKGEKPEVPNIIKKIEKARGLMQTLLYSDACIELSIELSQEIRKQAGIISFEARSVKKMHKCIAAFVACKNTFEPSIYDLDALATLVIGCVPESSTLVRVTGQFNGNSLKSSVETILAKYESFVSGVDLISIEDILKDDKLNESKKIYLLMTKGVTVKELQKKGASKKIISHFKLKQQKDSILLKITEGALINRRFLLEKDEEE